MDNITHTLIGTLVGEVAARAAPSNQSTLPAPLRRNLCVTLAAIGSNLPDSDLLYSFFGGKVNYLLHHRGHTHTIVIALLLGVAVMGVTRWWLRRRGLQPSRQDLLLLMGILLFTPLLHIGMDFTNNYGVHPLWPFNNQWFYGDSVFIIEPLFWAACAPLAVIFRTRAAQFIMLFVLAAAIGLCLFTGLVPHAFAAAYSILVVAMLFLGRKAPAKVALAAGVALWLGATLMFVLSAQAARAHVDAAVAQQFPGSELLDRIVTPMPTNPLCWEVATVERDGDNAIVRRAMLALSPSLLPVDQCRSRSHNLEISAPLVPVAASASNEQLQWHGQVSTPIDQLQSVAKTNCEAAAALRFIRVPWLAMVKGELVLGDLRYDLEPELGFAEIVVNDKPRCPPFVPRWREPRHDLLRPSP